MAECCVRNREKDLAEGSGCSDGKARVYARAVDKVEPNRENPSILFMATAAEERSALTPAYFFTFNFDQCMDSGYKNFVSHIMQDPGYNCPLCGARRYVTDQGNHELTLHCSSSAARFWDFPRDSMEQLAAKQHWDSSRKDIFLSMEDVLKFLMDQETLR